jgi:hypothetical protein
MLHYCSLLNNNEALNKKKQVKVAIEELVCSTYEGKNLKDWDDESCPQCNNLMLLDEQDQILWD